MAVTIAGPASRWHDDCARAHDVFVTNGATGNGAARID